VSADHDRRPPLVPRWVVLSLVGGALGWLVFLCAWLGISFGPAPITQAGWRMTDPSDDALRALVGGAAGEAGGMVPVAPEGRK